MGKKPGKTDPDDLALWQQVARETKPIRRRAVAPEKRVTPATTRPAVPDSDAGRADAAARHAARHTRPTPAAPPVAVRAEPRPLERGQVAGVDKRQAERLKRGRTEIEARLDLHGMTLENARRRLTAFLEQAQDDGRRAVLVVTGKGGREGTGVIRAQVPRWLNEPRLRPLILAFEYAQPKDGGMGALYILLRRRR